MLWREWLRKWLSSFVAALVEGMSQGIDLGDPSSVYFQWVLLEEREKNASEEAQATGDC